MADSWTPTGVDTSKPSPARMYDYYLGGKDNYEVDRAAAAEVFAVEPQTPALARENRGFLQRVVRFLVTEAGIRQFIDIGSGLPTQGNVHDVAQGADDDARVAYVDNDPVVLAHNRELLSGSINTTTVPADLRRPDEILTHPKLRGLIDLDQPVAVLLIAVLHFVTDDEDPAGIVARLRGALPSGSYLALSHISANSAEAEHGAAVYDKATFPITLRSHRQIEKLLAGLDFVEPGLVNIAEWQPTPGSASTSPEQVAGVFRGAVARKP